MDYEKFFGLNDLPFRVKPEPYYYFQSESHRLALETLMNGIKAGEKILILAGDPGVGKTLVLRVMLDRLDEALSAVLVFNPKLAPDELLKIIIEDLGIESERTDGRSVDELFGLLNEELAKRSGNGSGIILLIDEAQNLPAETLEALEYMSGLSANGETKLQIVLAVQSGLQLDRPGQNISHAAPRIQLEPLSRKESFEYVKTRLERAGATDGGLFPARILKEIHRLSGGVPRFINVISERTLIAAFVDGNSRVTHNHLKKALESFVEITFPAQKPASPTAKPAERKHRAVLALAVMAVALLLASGWKMLVPSATPDKSRVAEKIEPSVSPSAPETEAARPKEPETVTSQEPLPAAPPSSAMAQPAAPEAPQTAQETLAEPMIPLPPSFVVQLPEKAFMMTINRERQTAYLWEGGSPHAVLKAEFRWSPAPSPGMYIIGQNKADRRFAFKLPKLAYDGPALPSQETWSEIKNLIRVNMIPVIVFSPAQQAGAADLDAAEQVGGLITKWADAWRNKDADTLASFFDEQFTTYPETEDPGKAETRDSLLKAKKGVFEKSGPIHLALSDPVILLDPAEPGRLAAVFYQKYDTQTYSDEGFKTLFFKKIGVDSGGRSWKIDGRFFVLAEQADTPPAKPVNQSAAAPPKKEKPRAPKKSPSARPAAPSEKFL